MEKLNEKQLQAFRYIRKCIVHNGKSPSIADVKDELGYSSRNSAAVVIGNLIRLGLVRRREDKKLQLARDLEIEKEGERTVEVPLVGVVPCGNPVISDEHIEAKIFVSEKLARPPHTHFLLRANGDSMDLAGINDGDLVLVRQQPTANNGDYAVALVDGEATIKEFQHKGEVVILKPKSSNEDYKPLIVSKDLMIQGIVVQTIPNFEEF